MGFHGSHWRAHSPRARLEGCVGLYTCKRWMLYFFLLFLSSGEWRLGKSEKGALAPAFVYALSLCIVLMDRDTESSKDNKCFFFLSY